MSFQTTSKLFEPTQIGDFKLQHRVVLAPLTRFKATEKTHVPHVKLLKEYYTQRGSVPGTLLISEGAYVAQRGGGHTHAPGLWSDEQLAAWKEVTDAVHKNGSVFFTQLWAMGRAAEVDVLLTEDPNFPYASASPIKLRDRAETPRALTVGEIKEYVQLYVQAAKNAVGKAGFDGVEIHCANGYLLDQFIQDVSNQRDDEYGGSLENRARFPLEVIDGIVEAIGAGRVGVRFSPWAQFLDMRMEDPRPTFSYFVSQLKERHPDLAYIHLVEPRIDGAQTRDTPTPSDWSNDFLRDIWAPRPVISAGAYARESAIETADKKGDLIAFGRYYISNPDLPLRLKKSIPLTPYDRATYYIKGDHSEGYSDYPIELDASTW